MDPPRYEDMNNYSDMPFIGKCHINDNKGKRRTRFYVCSKIINENVVIFSGHRRGLSIKILNNSNEKNYFKCDFNIRVSQNHRSLIKFRNIIINEACFDERDFEVEYEFDTFVRHIFSDISNNNVKCSVIIKIYYDKEKMEYRGVLTELKMVFRYELLCEWRNMFGRIEELKFK